MVVKAKEKFEKTRNVKKMINLKNRFYEEKEMEDIMIKFYQKDNIIFKE